MRKMMKYFLRLMVKFSSRIATYYEQIGKRILRSNNINMSGIKHIDGYDIHMKQLLGQGSFGAVYVGYSEKTKEKVAVKVLKKNSIDSDEYLKTALLNEIKIMQTIKSENIVGFLDVMESPNNYYIIQELCDGDLSELMKPGHPVDEKKAVQYLRQMANGFLALVKQGTIHRDLKPANIMRKENVLKIGDFGFAKKTEGASCKKQTIVGTPLYMSLEVLKCQAYSSKCDIWALGFIFYEMLHGRTPWTGKSQFDLIKKIESKPLQIDSSFSKNTIDFLKKSLSIYEEKRMSWDEVFAHPIFQGYFANEKQFQNKLKMVMSDLRFHINSNNLDLCIILAGLGYKGNEEINRDKFHQFLKIVSPSIKRQESEYIFSQVDKEKKGTITIKQIEALMNENNIGLRSIYQHIPGVMRTDTMSSDSGSSNVGMDASTEKKVRSCFRKLLDILRAQNKMLYDVFNVFDKEKSGNLNLNQFKNMLRYLSTDINDDEIGAAFDHIDSSKRGRISFEELNSYFSKVNGIPEHLNRPHDPKNSVGQPAAFFQQMINPGYIPQYNPYGYYPPPQYYQPHPNMYNQHCPPPPGYYNPYMQQPNINPPGGFILGKLSQNLNSNPQFQQPPPQPQPAKKEEAEKKKKKGWW